MNDSGNLTGVVASASVMSVPDGPLHEIRLMHVMGRHTSDDWKDMEMDFYAVLDTVDGTGRALGYFTNRHPDGSAAYGSFDAPVNGNAMSGKYTIQRGVGRFAGIQGAGSFSTSMQFNLLTMRWEGRYTLPEAATESESSK